MKSYVSFLLASSFYIWLEMLGGLKIKTVEQADQGLIPTKMERFVSY